MICNVVMLMSGVFEAGARLVCVGSVGYLYQILL